MFRTTKSRVVEKNQNFSSASFESLSYPTRLNFYKKPPVSEISIEEFETWAIDRLVGTLSIFFIIFYSFGVS